MMFSSDILDKDRFWNEEMKQVNKSTLMGCSINFQETEAEKHGIQSGHAYSVLNTAEFEGERLVHVSGGHTHTRIVEKRRIFCRLVL